MWNENEIVFRTYLIGDAGYHDGENRSIALDLLEQKLTNAGTESAVIFLGDNIYPKGLAGKSHVEARAAAEKSINGQLETLRNFDGRPLFIPGNHDWGRGLDAV